MRINPQLCYVAQIVAVSLIFIFMLKSPEEVVDFIGKARFKKTLATLLMLTVLMGVLQLNSYGLVLGLALFTARLMDEKNQRHARK